MGEGGTATLEVLGPELTLRGKESREGWSCGIANSEIFI